MTCIVAVEDDRSAWIGTDSFVGTSIQSGVIDRPKWAKVGGVVYAFAGSLRGPQLLKQLKPASIRSGEDEQDYLAKIASLMRAQFGKHGANVEGSGKSDTHEGTFIAVLRGKVFLVQEDYSVVRSQWGFATAGAGEDFAAGVLMATQGDPPKERLELALEVACQLCPLVRGPFHIAEVK